MPPIRRLTLAATAALVGLSLSAAAAPGQPAQPRDRSVDNAHVVSLTRTRPYSQYRGSAGVAYHQTFGPTLNANNLASSNVTCDNCHGNAISFQTVVGNLGPRAINVSNRAQSATLNCADCSSAAVAYQFIVAVPDRAYLTLSARMRLMAIHFKVNVLARSTADPMEVKERTAAYAAEVATLLETDLRRRPRVRKYLWLEAVPTGDKTNPDAPRTRSAQPERLSLVEQDDSQG